MAIGLFYEAGGREAGDKDRDMQAAPVISEAASSASANHPARRVPDSNSNSNLNPINNPVNIFTPSQRMTLPPSQPVVHVLDESEEDEDEAPVFQSYQPRQLGQPQPATRAQRLANLFRSPHEIMFPGTLDSARRHARSQNRWLLVSFLVPTEFGCQALNRDCWNDPQLQEFIRENLVFVQLAEGSPEAARYRNFYPFDDLHPHTAIIDPRTGERVKTLLLATIPVPGFRKIEGAGEMLEELVGFVSEQVMEPVEPNRASYLEAVSSIGGERADSNVTGIDTDSTEANDGTTATSSTSTTSSTSATSTTLATPVDEQRCTSPTAGKRPKLTYTMPPEPSTTTTTTTTIQLRLPDGSRLRRRFSLSAPLEELFAVAEAACQQSRNEFELRSAEAVIEGNGTVSIGEMPGLRNSVITIVQK